MWIFVRKLTLAVLTLLFASGGIYWLTRRRSWLMFTAALATLAYHILMRSAVANTCNAIMHNHADYRKWWFRVSDWEERLYRVLRVKQWKKKVPTYDPESFNIKTHSWDEIAQTTCQSEVVHESNLCLSFLPVVLARRIGGFRIQLAVSLMAAVVESCFIMIQRYNRYRSVRILDRMAERVQKKRT